MEVKLDKIILVFFFINFAKSFVNLLSSYDVIFPANTNKIVLMNDKNDRQNPNNITGKKKINIDCITKLLN